LNRNILFGINVRRCGGLIVNS